jgi:protein subunit release factor B
LKSRQTLPSKNRKLRFPLRSSGPGGQNVNKAEAAAQLRFDVTRSASLDEALKRRLQRLAGAKLTKEGVLVIFAQTHRSREQNRREALARFACFDSGSGGGTESAR